MSNQLQITGGAKVRALEGVITGTSGVLSSVPLGAANGVATLDSGGKVPVSQLPSSVVTYLGTWNAATNTPTLVNGTGDAGDLYLCNVAGTVNFGAGPIVFVVGDWVLYGSGTWQKSSGQNGTVTSVAASITGNSLGITGSPITTAGTLAFAFAGTNSQYINGAGNLTTFPTLITSIGLSMPSAFSVANSPLTANGSINVTGAGTTGQYIRGDGSLATYNPGSGGGGSSQTFYFNGGVASSVTGYQQMSTTANTGASADFSVSSNGYIASFLTDSGSPNQLLIPAGNWNFEIYMNASSSGGSPSFYVELYKYASSTFTLIATSSANPEYITNGTVVDLYTTALTVPQTTLTLTDRLAVRVYVVTSGRTITMHTQDSNLSEVITTFSTGITALNGLTAQVQYFATGTSGTDFNISSTTATHTFNIPDASATARGLITTGTQTIAGIKTFNLSTKNETGIQLKNDIGIVPVVTGYTNLNGLSAGLAITNSAGVSNNLLVPSTTGYSYTFPSATGTLALTSNLSSYLPLTGGTMTGSILLNNNLTISGQLFGTSSYASMLAMSPSDKVLIDNSGRGVIFGGTIGQGAYTYTFPSASGTLALTSNLSAYLPLTGGTLSGSLSASTYYSSAGIFLLTSGQATSGSGYATINGGTNYLDFRPANGGIFLFQFPYNTTRTFTLPDATGTLPLGTGTTNYHTKWTGTNTIGNSLIWDNGTNVGIGNTNTSYTLDVSGTGRFTGAITGGSTLDTAGNITSTVGVTNTSLKLIRTGNTFECVVQDNQSRIRTFGASGNDKDLLFDTDNAGTTRLFIKGSNGNVGIGTSSPAYKLEVSGVTVAKAAGNAGRFEAIDSTLNTNLTINPAFNSGEPAIQTQSNSPILFAPNNTEKMRLLTGGQLGLNSSGAANIMFLPKGTTSDSSAFGIAVQNSGSSYTFITRNDGIIILPFLGSGTVSASSGTLSASSDMNLKTEDGYIENALDKVLKLKPRYFYWKEESSLPTDIRQLGFYAQEVNEALGEEVANTPKDENDKWGIYDRGIIAILTKAIQEMNTKLDEQNQTIQNLQEQINILAK